MKVSPLAAPTGMVGQSVTSQGNERTATPEKLAVAKAIAAGETNINVSPSDIPVDPSIQTAERNIRRMKMNTNFTTNRYDLTTEAPNPVENIVIPDATEQATPVVEDTKPISPQLAAIARQRRALQVKERELAQKEEALSKATPQDGYISKEDLKANPLKIFELGVTYDELTNAIMGSNTDPKIKALEDELKSVRAEMQNGFKTREQIQEQAALTEMLNEAETLAKDGDRYELIRGEDAYEQVLRKIYTHFKSTGQVMNVTDAMDQVENELLESNLKRAQYNKIKSKLLPTENVVQPTQTQTKEMRTLTNRDGAMIPMDRKARAIAAMNGTLKR